MDERIRKTKTYKDLYDQFISDENIRLAIKRSSKGKRKRARIRKIYENPDKYIPKIRRFVENYVPRCHTVKEIYDGITRKKRTIVVPTYMEQIMHHMLVQVLIPMFSKGMYYHSYGSIPGRGPHKGKKYIERWLSRDPKFTKYCLKMDIRKYFDNVSRDKLKQMLKSKIKDAKFLTVIFKIIDVPDMPDGIPVGFYTSQWFANWYLQDLDHYIKQDLLVTYYVRYMDDLVLFGPNKTQLHFARLTIEDYLLDFKLALKPNWQVFKTESRDVNFMGFRFYKDKTLLRKGIMYRATSKARSFKMKEKPTVYDCRQMLSYKGWLNATDTYCVYEDKIRPFIKFGACQGAISAYDRRKAQNGMEKNREFEQCKAV